MARIHVERRHALSHKKARDVAEKLAKGLEARFDLAYAWHGDHVDFERPGVSGRLRVAPDRIVLDVELGFLLSAFKPAIEREIVAQLDRHCGKPKA